MVSGDDASGGGRSFFEPLTDCPPVTHATLDGTGPVTGTVRAVPGRRCGRESHRETLGAVGRPFPGVPAAERTPGPDPDFGAGEGGPGR